jgi:hypothetical protein
MRYRINVFCTPNKNMGLPLPLDYCVASSEPDASEASR